MSRFRSRPPVHSILGRGRVDSTLIRLLGAIVWGRFPKNCWVELRYFLEFLIMIFVVGTGAWLIFRLTRRNWVTFIISLVSRCFPIRSVGKIASQLVTALGVSPHFFVFKTVGELNTGAAPASRQVFSKLLLSYDFITADWILSFLADFRLFELDLRFYVMVICQLGPTPLHQASVSIKQSGGGSIALEFLVQWRNSDDFPCRASFITAVALRLYFLTWQQ